MFSSMAAAYLNHTVLVVKPSGSNTAPKYFRVAEIEFYLNDHRVHKDTFTHGDELQKQTGKWYFHKFGNSYRSGTYKGVDITIGKGAGAVGGILLRSLMPLQLTSSSPGSMVFGNGANKKDFIEGPCNCVNRILEETKPQGTESFDIANLVARTDFSLDIFDESSCMHLLCDTSERKVVLPQRTIAKSPRVGLTLKRYDAEKEKFWMADLRYLTFPALHAKMKDYIVLAQLAAGSSITATSELTASKVPKVEELSTHFNKGREAGK